jgi:tRNA (guanine26-N2/guanine27-N2)-dimethyltransferase
MKEGKVEIVQEKGVFYNPAGELLRDISVSALQVFQKQAKIKLNICDALSATGIRGIRYSKEVKGIKEVVLNDKNPVAVKVMKKNIKLNKLKNCRIEKKDANMLLREKVFNVIDLDPFGSPNVFMDSASKSIWHKGFLMVTATDTAPLCGTYPKTCLRKYGIESIKTDFYNELGIRILTTFIMLNVFRYERTFIPVLVLANKHYFRIFGRIEHLGKASKILDDFGYVMYCQCGNRKYGEIKEKCFCGREFRICGKIYLGSIIDKKFCREMIKDLEKRKFRMGKEELKILNVAKNEVNIPFYYDIHRLAKILKIKELPKIEEIIKKLKKKGFKASRTSLDFTGIKTDASFRELKGFI